MEEIFLVRLGTPTYDPVTGDYSEPDEIRVRLGAEVSPVTVTNANLMYGNIKKRAIVVRNPFPLTEWRNFPFDYLEFRGRKYTLDNDNAYGFGITTFYLSEV